MYETMNANRVAQALVGGTVESYRTLTERAVGLQESRVRFFQSLVEEGTRQARRQADANIAVTQNLLARAEERREALRKLTKGMMHASLSFAVSPMGYSRGTGETVTHEEKVQEETAPKPVARKKKAKAAPKNAAFPIPSYAKLKSTQVLKKLDGLSVAELKKVRAYEMEHKNRKTVLAQLEQRLKTAR